MADIIKFVYVIIIVLFIFFSGKNIDGKTIFFLSFSNYLLYFAHNILSHFSNILLFTFSSQQRIYALMMFIVKNISARLVYIQRV
ncbi:hypothetical protein MtrunA17_Chr7g0224951 [Medicago truncatula]|uniref:Transmembrane protein n=1 Tax=Medicago truncatula TaxID=3880 RepID=A0A396GZR8_MEDTR|nr:hypothetical protein MtrunA17_Chr7g0224911 [Medicago truncatula]RHN44948.1 hypothetical protein MtrunA17_Chr7g0224951 [Medicago truncatula]